MASTIGERLRKLRTDKDLTLEQAARLMNLTFSILSMYERGERTPPIDKLRLLAQFYGVSVAYLIGETDRPVSFDREADQPMPQDKPERYTKIGLITLSEYGDVELYTKIKEKEVDQDENKEAPNWKTALAPEELQEIEDDKLLAEIPLMAAHMEGEYGKPMSREMKRVIAEVIRSVREEYIKEKMKKQKPNKED